MMEAEAQREQNEKTVLLAMDGSQHAMHALEWYMEHLAQMSDKLIIAYCAASSTGLSPTVLVAGNPTVIQQVTKQHEEEVNKVLDTLEQLAKKHKIHHKIELLYGSPGEAVIEFAEQQNVDMVVTGSRGLGLIRRTIMGSTWNGLSQETINSKTIDAFKRAYDQEKRLNRRCSTTSS